MNGADRNALEAERTALQQQAAADATDPAVHHRLGEVAAALGELESAVHAFAMAAQLRSGWASPCFGLGHALRGLNQHDAAILAFRTGLALEPDDAEAHFALARSLERRGQAEDATDHYRAASRHRPDWAEPLLYLGALHEGSDEGRDAYDRALALGAPPGFALRRDLNTPVIATSAEAYATARKTYARNLARLLEAPPTIADPIREAGGNRFFLAYYGLDDRPLQEGLARLFLAGCPSLAWTAPHCRTGAAPGMPRRVGIASRHLHDHSIGRLMVALLADLARSNACRIFLFHAGAPRDDALRREIEGYADAVAVLPGDLASARETIAAAELDILFYPDIGMDPVTYFLAFARLAPVQCATWGHPVTTGIPAVDYYLSCDAAEPEGAAAHYSERLVRLGGLPFSYRRPARPEPPRTRADFGLDDDATVYFLAQNLFKIHPDMDAPLAAILRGDPTGVLLLPEGQGEGWNDTLRARFRKTFGDMMDRVVFLPRQTHDDYMRLLMLADVSLDSFPFSGGNTTYQALAMDTPVVTLPGNYLRGRLSLAIYHHMGVTDCIARDPADYARIALRLGTDAAFRAQVEARIADRADTIFDDPVFLDEARRFLLTAEPRR